MMILLMLMFKNNKNTTERTQKAKKERNKAKKEKKPKNPSNQQQTPSSFFWHIIKQELSDDRKFILWACVSKKEDVLLEMM